MLNNMTKIESINKDVKTTQTPLFNKRDKWCTYFWQNLNLTISKITNLNKWKSKQYHKLNISLENYPNMILKKSDLKTALEDLIHSF